MTTDTPGFYTLERGHLQQLFDVLREVGYALVGPTVREDAIVYDTLTSVADLPEGWTDAQEGGKYRLARRPDRALFGYAVGPHSWKKYLLPPRLRLWAGRGGSDGFEMVEEPAEGRRLAFIGVRSCEISAMLIQDRVLMGGKHVDPHYQARREAIFVVAVQCGQAGGTCFCVSMNTGPRARAGFDLALTEVLEGDRHYFVVETGSEAGREVWARVVAAVPATAPETLAADAVIEETARSMGRQMDTGGIRDLLYGNLDHPRWDDVARRCLTCGNCTQVCPTCFCTTVDDVTDLSGQETERWRRWDSCFTQDFSWLHGGSVRTTARSRYRQWMTHKLATWFDQFGTSGCVGCGRCVTWCPVGIDITEEVRAIRATGEDVP